MGNVHKRNDNKVKHHIAEIEHLILERFPGAEFEVYRDGPKDYRIHVYGTTDYLFDVLDLTSDKVMDVLEEEDMYIHVSPLGKKRKAG